MRPPTQQGTGVSSGRNLDPVNGEAPTSPLVVQPCGSAPTQCYFQVIAEIGDPSSPGAEWEAPFSPYVQVQPPLGAPNVSATWTNQGVSLDVTPPPLPAGATIWGYQVDEASDAAGDGGQFWAEFDPVNGQAPTSPLAVGPCGSAPGQCYFQVIARIGDPNNPNPEWQAPFSPYVTSSTSPPSGTLQAGGNPNVLPTTCSCGAPVNTDTGEFWHTFTDLSVPGRGIPLDLTRTYSSAAASTLGPLGYRLDRFLRDVPHL